MYTRVINYLAFCTVMGVTDFMIGQDRMQVDLLKLSFLNKT